MRAATPALTTGESSGRAELVRLSLIAFELSHRLSSDGTNIAHLFVAVRIAPQMQEVIEIVRFAGLRVPGAKKKLTEGSRN